MKTRVVTPMRLLMALVALTACTLTSQTLTPPSADAAVGPATSVTESPAQVAQLLFVAGDVGRLSRIPSGTESVVLERVLQQLYVENPSLDPAQAVKDIQDLQSALSTGPQALSASTLTVMAGNERALAILHVLESSNAPADVAHALAQVNDQVLSDTAKSEIPGQAFNASVDSLDTVSFMSLSPAGTLARSAALAATTKPFGQARDSLWKQASGESVFDDAATLVNENPALQSSAIKGLLALVGSDGSLQTTVGALENIVRGGIGLIDEQNCKLAGGSTGASPSDCVSGALHDAQLVATQCPNGSASTGAGCQDTRNQVRTDATDEEQVIAAQQAVTTAAAEALARADQGLAQAEAAEAQAAARVTDEENQYLNYQSTLQYVKGGFDIAALATTLGVSGLDPAAALEGVLNVVGFGLGFGIGGNDPNMIILDGIQNISRQIGDFETYTQSAFRALDSQLSALSGQIAQDALKLSAQLTQAQQQITQLGTELTNLQGSVDHLQSEVQSLFAQGARNDLGTLVNQYIGYEHANGTPLPQSQFATAAGALYQDATSTALTSTILTVPTAFDAFDANALVTTNDPVTLDSNINFFNAFPAGVSDSPTVSWPGALTNSCAVGADQAQKLCLPDPDFWATSARAFAQLLTENPAYVTPVRLQQLDAIVQEGQVIANALHQLSTNDAGTDAGGTGNKTLDAALKYYAYWGAGPDHDGGSPPSLPQAIRNEEQRYLGTQTVPGQSVSYQGVDPWGGVNQPPDVNGLQATTSFTNIPLCQDFIDKAQRNLGQGTNFNPSAYTLPYLPAGLIGWLPARILDATRLGVGHISACWEADGGIGPTASLVHPYFYFNYVSTDGSVNAIGTMEESFDLHSPNSTCLPPDLGVLAGVNLTIANWPGEPNRNRSCLDVSQALSNGLGRTATLPPNNNAVVPAMTSILTSLQRGVYTDILSNGSTLTHGASEATDVQGAATRLAGAGAILNGYVSLGLPQSLASDDVLRSLVSGANADAFARTDPTINVWNVAPAASVPAQVVAFYKAAQQALPFTDPATTLGDQVSRRASDLTQAIRPHIVGSSTGTAVTASRTVRLAAAVTAQQTNAVLAENNPLIAPTIDRVAETRTALADALANGAMLLTTVTGDGTGTISGSGVSCATDCAKSFTPGTTITLTATPTNGSAFTGWSGPCSGTGSCTVKLDYDERVTATFAAGPAGGGTGTGGPGGTGSGGAGTGSKGTGTGVTGTGRGTASHAPRCSVAVPNTRILLAKPAHGRARQQPGTVVVRVLCNQSARVSVAASVTTSSAGKRGHVVRRSTVHLRPIARGVAGGIAASVTVRLPVAVLRALAQKRQVSATFAVRATSSGATANIAVAPRRLRA